MEATTIFAKNLLDTIALFEPTKNRNATQNCNLTADCCFDAGPVIMLFGKSVHGVVTRPFGE